MCRKLFFIETSSHRLPESLSLSLSPSTSIFPLPLFGNPLVAAIVNQQRIPRYSCKRKSREIPCGPQSWPEIELLNRYFYPTIVAQNESRISLVIAVMRFQCGTDRGRDRQREGENKRWSSFAPVSRNFGRPSLLSCSLSCRPESSVNLFDVVCVPFAKRGIVESAVG